MGRKAGGKAAARGGLKNKGVQKCARAAALLAGGVERKQICSELGIHRNTLSGWMKDAVFVALVEEAYVRVAQHDRERVWRFRKECWDAAFGVLHCENKAARARVALAGLAATGGLEKPQQLGTLQKKFRVVFANLPAAQLPAPGKSNEQPDGRGQ
jgi:hypothetical protein